MSTNQVAGEVMQRRAVVVDGASEGGVPADRRTSASTDAAPRATQRDRSGSGPWKICAPDLFSALLFRERALAQRCNYSFSVLELDLRNCAAGARASDALARAVIGSVRETDIAGWLHRNCMGVILPATSALGAERLAARIALAIPLYAAQLRHSAQEYGPASFIGGEPGELLADEAPLPPAEAFSRIPRWKRLIDIVVSSLALVALAPLFVAIVATIEAVSPGPFLFRQERIGYLGRRFTCLKFRSMRIDTVSDTHRDHVLSLLRNGAPLAKLENVRRDTRLIPLGAIMRASGLDELPQLINVLVGDMSLVGPRPCIPYEFAQFSAWHRERCLTPPGLTGLWQVSGKNATTHEEMMRLDIRYAKRLSLVMDLGILMRTPAVVVSQVRRVIDNAMTGRAATRHKDRRAAPAALAQRERSGGMV